MEQTLMSLGVLRDLLMHKDFSHPKIESDFEWIIKHTKDIASELTKGKVKPSVIKIFQDKVSFLEQERKSSNIITQRITLTKQKESIMELLNQIELI